MAVTIKIANSETRLEKILNASRQNFAQRSQNRDSQTNSTAKERLAKAAKSKK